MVTLLSMGMFRSVARGGWALAGGLLFAVLVGCNAESAVKGEAATEQVAPIDTERWAQREDALGEALPLGFQEELVVSGVVSPIGLAFTSNGKMIVIQKSGRVLAFDAPYVPGQPGTLVVDLSEQTHAFWDRGLLGVAVDPAFPAVPHIYVTYAFDAYDDGTYPRWGTGALVDGCPNPPGATELGCVINGRLSRIVVDPATMVGAEQPLLSGHWCQQFPSHGMGALGFGADGMLYLSSGDGASYNVADWGQFGNPCGDPPEEGGALRTQDILTSGDPLGFNGSLLRIDVSGHEAAVPPDNPLGSYVVAVGLRNPYRFAVRPGTNELWIGDVGWGRWEEINVLADPSQPRNFGWPCFEGVGQNAAYRTLPLCQLLYNTPAPAGLPLQEPFFAYSHSVQVAPGDGCGAGQGGSSVTGLAFNSGSSFPSQYDNALFFADSSRRCIWTVFAGANGKPDAEQRAVFLRGAIGLIVDLKMGPDGALYYVDHERGRVYRIAHYAANTPPVAAVVASVSFGPSPLSVDFDASGSSDAEDGSNLTFEWDLDGDGSFADADGPTASHTYSAAGTHVVSVRVTDSGGSSRMASAVVVTDNSPPVPHIEEPQSDVKWSVGDAVAFAGWADDQESGLLGPAQLSWDLVLHHCYTLTDCHEHPLTSFVGVAAGSFDAPDHDYPSYLELRLTATDTVGGSWHYPDWHRRLPITVTGAFAGEDLHDVPVLVKLDTSRIDYAFTAPEGADLRFASASSGPLEYDIDTWVPGGTSTIWVRLEQLASASGDTIYMYYDHPAAPKGEHPHGVWEHAGYVGVWHLDPTLTDYAEEEGEGEPATLVDAQPIAGQLGGALHFDGANSHVDFGTASKFDLTGQLSIEAWVRPNELDRADHERILSKKTAWDAASGFEFELRTDTSWLTGLGGGADFARAIEVPFTTEWHHLGADLADGVGQLYFDGVGMATDQQTGPILPSAASLTLGAASSGGAGFLGDIDEVRLSDQTREPNWFAVQNMSMRDLLLTFGSPQTPEVLTTTTSVLLEPNTVEVVYTSQPAGLALTVGSEDVTTPYTMTSIHGSHVSVSAPPQQTLSGIPYDFVRWSDDGAAVHTIAAGLSSGPVVATYSSTAEWHFPLWARRMVLTVTGDYAGGSVADFPVPVRLTPARFNYESAAVDGRDLRFCLADGTLLDYEIDEWNPEGNSLVWLKLPTLAPASNETVFLYYDNPEAPSSEAPASVWSNGYSAVWHLGDTLVDSTDMAAEGEGYGAAVVPGFLGQARQFDGRSSHINMGASQRFEPSAGALTVEAWVRVASAERDRHDRIVSTKFQWDDAAGYDFEVRPGKNWLTLVGGDNTFLRGASVNVDTAWHYYASAVHDTTGIVMVDGVDLTTLDTIAPLVGGGAPLVIGMSAGGIEPFLGDLDEIRISSVARSPDWLRASHAGMRDALLNYGPEETEDGGNAWPLSEWQERISLNAMPPLIGAPFDDIPVLIRLTPERINYAVASPTGADVRVTDAAGNAIPHEIDHWTPGGTSELWVKPSVLQAGSTLYLYYGNAAALDGQQPGAVWANGYAAVWHLDPALQDSTGSLAPGTNKGAQATEGLIGTGMHFDGQAAAIEFAHAPSLAIADTLTVEAWVRLDDLLRPHHDRIVSKKLQWTDTTGFELEVRSDEAWLTALGSGADFARALGVPTDTNWHHLASTAAGSEGRLFFDGADVTQDGVISAVVASFAPLVLGQDAAGGSTLLGTLDEVRLSQVARTADWMQTQYSSVADALFMYGAVEQHP